MNKVSVWFCESKDNGFHAFCLLRSPYKNSVKKKVQFLADGHGFLNWSLTKLTPESALEWLQKYEADSLYVSHEKVK